jgi:hypothetical protein
MYIYNNSNITWGVRLNLSYFRNIALLNRKRVQPENEYSFIHVYSGKNVHILKKTTSK